MALTLLRHTRPVGAEGLCYGASDIALAPDFATDADAVADRVDRPSRILTSPLTRCLRLAQHLSARFGAPVTVEDDWREMDFGSWEARPWSAIPRPELDAWATDFLHARPHGGESVAMLLARTRRALAGHRVADPTLVVTHAGVIRAALFLVSEDAAVWQRPVGFGELIPLDLKAVG